MTRDPAVETFLSSVRDALAARDIGPEAAASIDRIYAVLATPAQPGSGRRQRLSVCDQALPDAYATARRHSPDMVRITEAFGAIEPALFWAPRNRQRTSRE